MNIAISLVVFFSSSPETRQIRVDPHAVHAVVVTSGGNKCYSGFVVLRSRGKNNSQLKMMGVCDPREIFKN